MAQYKRIFTALDGASTQDAVARRAASLARSYNANLMFGHVIDSVIEIGRASCRERV